LVDQIGALAGEQAAVVAETIIRNADSQPDVGSLAGLASTGLLFVGATVVFAQLQGALNLIFRTGGEKLGGLGAWLRKRVFSLGVVLALGFLLIVSMIATTALQLVFARIPSLLPVVGYVTTLLLYALAFAFLYHYLPDRRVDWRQAWLGGAITSGLFALGRYLIGLYLAQAAPGSAYGSMGALVLLLVWMYYAALVFFAGALVTAVIDERAHARQRLRRAGIGAVPPRTGADGGTQAAPGGPARAAAPRRGFFRHADRARNPRGWHPIAMARLPDAFIDDLLARTDIVEIVGARVPLKRKGREYAAPCPFHDERTPSFYVSPTKQFYHCFGCGAHGTAISFLMNYDRLEFLDAVEELARRAGMEM